MNEFLESLEIGEDKVKLPKEVIKSILAEHGKAIKNETQKVKDELQKEIATRDTTITDLKSKIDNAPKSEELENLKQTIANYEKEKTEREENEKKAQKEQIILKNISEAIGDKKFVNDYTKNSIIEEIKKALNDENNAGKSAKDLFDSITKDKQGIFENSNPMPNMTGMGNVDNNSTATNVNKNKGIELNPMFKKF